MNKETVSNVEFLSHEAPNKLDMALDLFIEFLLDFSDIEQLVLNEDKDIECITLNKPTKTNTSDVIK